MRYAATYVDVKGRQLSAGTFSTEAQAMRAWQKAEEKIAEGRLGDARRGRQRFARYVEEQWLPHHQMEARTALAGCDAYILLLTEDGYNSTYVAHEVGAAVVSGKPLIALVDRALDNEPMGMLADIEQVRFHRNDLAASAAAITTGLVRLGAARGVPVEPATIAMPSQPALFSVSIQMDAQFQVTPEQVLVGVAAFMLIGGLIYLASREGGLGLS